MRPLANTDRQRVRARLDRKQQARAPGDALDADQNDPGHGGEQQPQQHPGADRVGHPEDADRFQNGKRQQQ
jgi:hypothetical protein